MSVFPIGTAIPAPGPETVELMVTPKTGGASAALGGSSLGGGGAGGGVGAGAGARRSATRGRGSGGGGGGSGAAGLMSGGGRWSSTSISIGTSLWKRAGLTTSIAAPSATCTPIAIAAPAKDARAAPGGRRPQIGETFAGDRHRYLPGMFGSTLMANRWTPVRFTRSMT